jgi:hypothetical protein
MTTGIPAIASAHTMARGMAKLITVAMLLQLAACASPPPSPSDRTPGCTGPASFCIPYFGP